MTLLQQVSCSYVSNDTEISEILRMKNQKRVQNVLTGGGIICDNSADKEEEGKMVKSSPFLSVMNDFDNEFLNNLFSKQFSLKDEVNPLSLKFNSKNCGEAEPTNSLDFDSNQFLKLDRVAGEEDVVSNLKLPQCDVIEPSKGPETSNGNCEFLAKGSDQNMLTFSQLLESCSADDLSSFFPFKPPQDASQNVSTKPSNALNISDSNSGGKILSKNFSLQQPLLNILPHTNSVNNLVETSQKSSVCNSPIDFFSTFNELASHSMRQKISQSSSCSSLDSTFESNLNDFSAIEKNIADKNPFNSTDSNFMNRKTVLNILAEKPPGHDLHKASFSNNTTFDLFNGTMFLNSESKLSSKSVCDYSGDSNNNINSDGGCSKSTSKAINNVEILSKTLKCLKISCWYYQNLSHVDAFKLLSPTQPGTFLVRNSSDSKFLFTLSMQTYRYPTSIRIQYSDGKFCLDCENSVTESVPKFDSIMELISYYIDSTANTVHYINNSVVNDCKQVLIDEYGKIHSNILLTKPYYSENKFPSLKHLARVNINKFQEFGYKFKINSDDLKKFMNEYPFTI